MVYIDSPAPADSVRDLNCLVYFQPGSVCCRDFPNAVDSAMKTHQHGRRISHASAYIYALFDQRGDGRHPRLWLRLCIIPAQQSPPYPGDQYRAKRE
jgi:hypothetical protein